MANPTPELKIPKRKQKGLIAHFGCQVAPFYKIDEPSQEGAPVILTASEEDTVEVAIPGSAPTGAVIGLTTQISYDPVDLAELSGYEYLNNTAVAVGNTVGIVSGRGWVLTTNYTGIVNVNNKLYPGPSGKLVTTKVGDDAPVGVAENYGRDGTPPIRVRIDLPATSPSGEMTGSIGPAEDGTYEDGIFTDFTPSTPIGTAIDRFNELFLMLAPQPAPYVDYIDSDDIGQNAKLSFGATLPLAGYSNVTNVGNLPNTGVNGEFNYSTYSEDYRLGVFDTTSDLTGTINQDVDADGVNYPENAFGYADQGQLVVEVNGTEVLTVDLTSTDAAITASNGWGTELALSAAEYGKFPNGQGFELYKNRTGTYKIAHGEARLGFNYARILHKISGVNVKITNLLSWVVDDDTSTIAASGYQLHDLTLAGTTYLTGVKYYKTGYAYYDVFIDNAYRNVYSAGDAISFGGSEALTIAPVAIPALNPATDTVDKVIEFSGTDLVASISAESLLNEDIIARVDVAHPLSGGLTNGGAATINNILLYNVTASGTVTYEDFVSEAYRLEPAAYNAQVDVPVGDEGDFDSTTDRSSGSELITYGGRVCALPSLTNAGDFSTIANGPSSNVDYSGLTGNLDYYRKFMNQTGGSKQNFDLQINGSATLVTSSASLGANDNVFVEIKVPGRTGWLTMDQYLTPGLADGDGCRAGHFTNILPATNSFTLGRKFIPHDDTIIIRITADAQWTGHIEDITLTWTT